MYSAIVIGASGLLGRHLTLDLKSDKPSHEYLDISNLSSVMNFRLSNLPLHICIRDIVLLAGYTNVANSNNEKSLAYKTNCLGVSNVVSLCKTFVDKPRLVYISTDYVFSGETGNYKVSDPLDPVHNNYYAYTKSIGETIARQYEKSLIIRTSFCRSDIWPYQGAFTDQFTSRDTIDIIAPLISKLINSDKTGTYHTGTERKSVYELAKCIDPNVEPMSRLDIKSVNIPFDTSLELTC